MSEHGLHLQQGLHQTIGPQLQQSLHILQVPSVELHQLIRAEMVQNPTLEEVSEQVSLDELGEGEDGFDETSDGADDFDEEWSDFLDQAPHTSNQRADEDKRRQFMLDSLVSTSTLQEHLREQIDSSAVGEEVVAAAEILLGDLDDRGFLETPLEDLCFSLSVPLPDLEKAKRLINFLDPIGVGAVDLRDCLLIQLAESGQAGSLPYRIVEGSLELLARNRFEDIARDMGVSTSQVNEAQNVIAGLDPNPARAFSPDPTVYVSPDIIVGQDGTGGFAVRLTGEALPELRISNDYRDMLAESGGDKTARSYVREKIRSGKFLIRSIEQRQDTIFRIASRIVELQDEFLHHGEEKLKPMSMAQMAELVGVHETTVSRAVSGKYMLTPQGLLEMRYFFTTGYETSDGESMSNVGVKNSISELVASEDTAHPLSDQKIVEELAEKGIKIARRTVAKYRDALHILPSNLRRTS